MTWTSVPDRSIGYAIVESDWDTYIRDNLNVGAWVCLAETVLAVDTASIDFQSINSSFAHLKVVIYWRAAAATSALLMRFNNDSAGNYDNQGAGASATFVGSPASDTFENFASTSIQPAFTPGSGSGANLFGAAEILIPHYANSANNKCAIQQAGTKFGTSTQQMNSDIRAGFWRSNSAINRITFSHPTGNMLTGSVATLMAMP